jgi:hypothetical protein
VAKLLRRLLLLSAEERRRVVSDPLDLRSGAVSLSGAGVFPSRTASAVGHVLQATRDCIADVPGSLLSQSSRLVENPLNPLSPVIARRQYSSSSSARSHTQRSRQQSASAHELYAAGSRLTAWRCCEMTTGFEQLLSELRPLLCRLLTAPAEVTCRHTAAGAPNGGNCRVLEIARSESEPWSASGCDERGRGRRVRAVGPPRRTMLVRRAR